MWPPLLMLSVVLLAALGFYYASLFSPETYDHHYVGIDGPKYRGYYGFDFEGGSFMPCDSSEHWTFDWSAKEKSISRIPAMEEGLLYFVEVSGRLSGPAELGHLVGGADRSLQVLTFKAVSQDKNVECINTGTMMKVFIDFQPILKNRSKAITSTDKFY